MRRSLLFHVPVLFIVAFLGMGMYECRDSIISGGGGGGGTYVPPEPTPVPASYWQSKGGQYSYRGNCFAGEEVDPVTTVVRHGSPSEIEAHLINDAGFSATSESPQLFKDNGWCGPGELSLGTTAGMEICFGLLCAKERWHVRCNIVSTGGPAGLQWASCTPHRDSADGSVFDGCTHVVHSFISVEGFSGSGFDVGRDWLWTKLVQGDGHFFEGAQYWGNTMRMLQCNGELTGANGWVNVIWIR
jgi:hypothetical protein